MIPAGSRTNDKEDTMAFRFLEDWAEQHRAKFYLNVRLWVGIGAAACKDARRRLTEAEHTDLIDKVLGGANSYERKLLIPLLDDEALCKFTEYCMGQEGGELGEYELARHYGDAVQREIAPLLVKRLRELSQFVSSVKPLAAEWGKWRETIEHLKETAAGQQKRADKLEQRLDETRTSVIDVAEERDDARAQLRAASAELDHARREVAAWEVQCQDLRDKMVQLQASQETQRKMGAKLADYLDSANGIIEEEDGDEEDIRDARELVAEARVVFGVKAS
jgi:hypothetical protein